MDNQAQQDTYYRQDRRHRGIIPGLLLVAIGLIFLLENLGFLHQFPWGKIWPLLLILVGLLILFRPRRHLKMTDNK